jgi:6-pyruvoyltetrahydropterin/6-carboxytetrahydropterin synthase
MYYITKEFSFDAAHMLGSSLVGEPTKQEEIFGKCCNLHGHRWTLFITIGSHALENGMVINFNELKKIINERIIEDLDHHYLNEVKWLKGVEPTCENLSEIIFKRLDKEFIGHLFLEEVKIYETPTSYCVYKE